MNNSNKAFWEAHGRVGLVWSNPNASDDQLIAAALLKQPNFHLLLEIACHFGLARLTERWEQLKADIEQRQEPDELQKLKRAQPIVGRCLATMKEAVRKEKTCLKN